MTAPVPRTLVVARDERLRERIVGALEAGGRLHPEPRASLEPADLAGAALVVAAWEPDSNLTALVAGRPNVTVVVVTRPGDGVAVADALETDVDDCVPADALGDGALLRRVHVALERRRRRSAAIFDIAMDGMFVLDDERRILTVNPAAEAMLGLRADELVGRPADDFVAPEHAGDAAFAWRRATERDRPTRREFTVRRADGQLLYVESTVSPNLSAGRHIIALRDVTARWRAEEEADRARDELQAVIDGLPSQVCVKDRQLRYRLINARTEEDLGVEPGWLIGRTDEAILRAEDIPAVRATDLRVLETGETVTSEQDLVLGGQRVVLLAQKFPLRDAKGEISAVCCVSTDITARQRLFADLRRSAERHAVIADLGRRALSGASAEEIMDLAARQLATALDVELTEVLELSGGPDSDLLVRAGTGWEGQVGESPPVPGGSRSMAGYAIAIDRPVVVDHAATETRFDARGLVTGHDVVSGLAVPITTAEGAYGAVVALSRRHRAFEHDDVTFLEAIAHVLGATITQERAADMRRRLEQAQRLEALGRLAGGIAHDFNNLLAVILSHADFALDDLPADAQAREDIAQVRLAARRAADLTRRLLTFGRPGTAAGGSIDIIKVLRETETLLRGTIGAHVEMIAEAGDQPLPCRAEPGQLEQIILNLATNARDAMSGGGRLTLRADAVDLEEGFPAAGRTLPAGRYARITVSDTGDGMDPEVVARAFDPFFTTKDPAHGTGLGLTTVHGIAAQHGGGVSVVSRPGSGTTVSVYLPLAVDPASVHREHSDAGETPSGHGQRILVVEDEEGVRRLVSRVLQRAGYEVIEARDGVAGLRAAMDPDRPVDLVLTDVVMPQLSGPQLVEQVRRVHPDAAVLFMSGYTPRMLAEQMRGDAAAPVLEKPFSSSALLDAVAERLGRNEVGEG